MVGDSCTNRYGKNYKYYKCAAIKKKTGTCELKPVNKDYIEAFVVSALTFMIKDKIEIKYAIEKTYETLRASNPLIPLFEQRLTEVNNKISRFVNAIEMGIDIPEIKDKMFALQQERNEISEKLNEEKKVSDMISIE